MSTSLDLKLKTLPEKPGVYQYFDQKGIILYVGKAKNLKKRVASYFTKNHDNGKTRILVQKIADIQYIVVPTEMDALILENNLIKEYQPRYNIQLKDDKTYPWICIKKEPFPRVFSTRQMIKDGSTYYGPYPNGKVMHTLLSLFRELFPLRTCSLDLSAKNIASKKHKVCLEYHLGNCKGPCVGQESIADYQHYIDQIEHILKGNISGAKQFLKQKMEQFAQEYAFEQAQEMKLKLNSLENYQAKSTLVSSTIHEVDVIAMQQVDDKLYFNYLSILNGSIIHAYTGELKRKIEENESELLAFLVNEMQNRYQSKSKEIISAQKFDYPNPTYKITIPQKGDKKQLLELSERNVKFYALEKRKQEKIKDPEAHKNRILNQIQSDFRLKNLPIHMECFDNSNIQGTNPVSACVVFKDGKPSKKDYRHFNIKTVEGPNDFASMEEVVYRRYKRLLEEGESLPQLIIIDGGKGQLSSALVALEKLNLRGKVAIVGIAKKLEEIFFPGDPMPLYIDKRSESLKVIQFMRNEAHRFGITHHRNKRSKAAITSELLYIEGIGPKTQIDLMKHFLTVNNIKKASLEELEKIVGKSKAQLVYGYFSEHADVKNPNNPS